MITRISLALTFALLCGCKTSAPKKQAEVDEHGNKIEYVYYTPMGSNIPVRVRKDQLKLTEAEEKQAQETFQQIQQRGVRPPKDS